MATHSSSYFALAACASIVLLIGLQSKCWAQDKTIDSRRPTVCTEQYLPVCGRIGLVTKTYSNACFASAAGAEVIAQGPCQTAPHPPSPK